MTKRYPYIKIHYADPFPKVTVTRRMDDDGARYFGHGTRAPGRSTGLSTWCAGSSRTSPAIA